MARRKLNTSGVATWVAIAAVAVLAIAVAVLSLFAYQRAHPPVALNESVAPIPTFGAEAPSPSSSPVETMTPIPSASPGSTAAVAAVDRPAERFLSIGSRAWWRGTAGACGVSAPLVERSSDGGRTWVDVTARYRQLAQVASLDAFTPTEGQLVGGIGSDCQVQALRTFTQGQFWESYPDVLATSSYVDLRDSSRVITPAGTLATPCAAATGLRSAGDRLAVVCAGEAYTLDAARTWQPTGVEAAMVVAFSADGLLVGHESASCSGLAVSLVVEAADPIEVGCAAGVDTSAGAVALGTDGSRVLVWAGDSIVDVAP
jgi:hypothetical protein